MYVGVRVIEDLPPLGLWEWFAPCRINELRSLGVQTTRPCRLPGNRQGGPIFLRNMQHFVHGPLWTWFSF